MDLDHIQPLLNWVSNHPYISYFIIFLVSLAESLVVVGFLIPGLTLMLAIGTLVGAGYLELWPAMIASVLGAIAGDGISFKIGQHYQQSIRDWFIFRRYPDFILRCEKFFAQHGSKSVVIGRFAGPVRPMIPAIAGMMKMPAFEFYIVNIISALLWAPSHLLPGVIFGNALSSLPHGISKKLAAIVFITLSVMWVITKIIRLFWRGFKHRVNRWGTRIWIYAESISLTVLQRIIKHPLTHKKHQVDSFLFLIFALVLTTLVVIFTKAHIIATALNPLFKHFALLLNYSPSVSNVLLLIDSNTSELAIISIFVGYFIFFSINDTFNEEKLNKTIGNKNIILNRHLYQSAGLLTAFFVTTYLISLLVKYPTPYQLSYTYTNLYSTSFPNTSMGLLTLLVGYIGIIKYCNDPKLYSKSSFSLYAAAILIFFILLKLYLGYTWFSDIIGAILISTCLLLIFCIIYWQKPVENIDLKKFNIVSAIIITTVIAINTTYVYFYHNLNEYNIATVRQNVDTQELLITDWQDQTNLFASSTDPIINVQWLGDLDDIKNILQRQKWQEQPPINFKSMLSFLENNPDITKLPVLPSYYQDHHVRLVYSKPSTSNKILTLRLWQSQYTIDGKTLWVGTVEYLKPFKYFDSITVLRHWPQREFSDSVNVLNDAIKTEKTISSKILVFKDQTLTDGELDIALIKPSDG